MANMKEMPIILGTLEIIFGFTSAIGYSLGSVVSSKHSDNLLAGMGCTAGLVPLMMRYSLKLWSGGKLEKVPDLIVCIWAIVWYVVGGAFTLIMADDGVKHDTIYEQAIAAFIAAILTLVDLILDVMNKQ